MTLRPPSAGGPANSPGAAPGDPLPVAEIVRSSYGLLRRHADDLLRLAVIPAAASFVIDVAAIGVLSDRPAPQPVSPAGGAPAGPMFAFDPWMLLLLFGLVPMALFAVNWLRVLLRGGSAVPGLGLRWGLRETRFLLRGVVILIIAGLAVSFPTAIAFAVFAHTPNAVPLVFSLGMLGYLYLLLRFVFGLVAVAMDESCGLGEAWTATKGVGGRFLVVVILVALPFWILGLLLPLFLGGIGLYAAAPYASLLLSTLLSYLAPAAALAAVAQVYRRLRPLPPMVV